MIFTDAYSARSTIEDALAWLREDGWTRADLDELAVESVERIFEDDEEELDTAVPQEKSAAQDRVIVRIAAQQQHHAGRPHWPFREEAEPHEGDPARLDARVH